MIVKVRRTFFSWWASIQLNRFKKACAAPEKIYVRSWKHILQKNISGPLSDLKYNAELIALREIPTTDYVDYQQAFQKSFLHCFNYEKWRLKV